MNYRHPTLGEDFQSIAGYYTVQEEFTMPHNGRLLLGSIGVGIVDSSCCGSGGCAFAVVAGYLIELDIDDDGAALTSRVEPITADEQEPIRRKIIALHPVSSVNFYAG